MSSNTQADYRRMLASQVEAGAVDRKTTQAVLMALDWMVDDAAWGGGSFGWRDRDGRLHETMPSMPADAANQLRKSADQWDEMYASLNKIRNAS